MNKNTRSNNHRLPKRFLAASAALTAATVAGNAAAQDFSGILTGLSGGTATTAVIAAAAIMAIVGFAVWGSKKVGKFFG